MRLLILSAAVAFGSFSLAEGLSDSRRPTPRPYPLRVAQELTVVCIRYTPGDLPLRIEDRHSALSPEDAALLSKYIANGTAYVNGRGVHEDGPKAKAILLLTGPFQRQVTVNQPWHSTVLYLQKGQTFTIFPGGAQLSDRRIYLEQQTDAPRYTTYMVDLTDGARQGGSAGAW